MKRFTRQQVLELVIGPNEFVGLQELLESKLNPAKIRNALREQQRRAVTI